MCPAHDWNAKSHYRWRQLCLVSISQVRPSHETPVRYSVLPNCTIWYTLSAPTLYIPTLLTNDKECFWEKTLANTLRVGNYHTHISLHICLWISSTPTSPFPYHWQVDSSNTYHTLSECQVIVWCCWEALEEAKDGRCNMELVAGFEELDKKRFWEVLLE